MLLLLALIGLVLAFECDEQGKCDNVNGGNAGHARARVQHQAPAFRGAAVIDGKVKEFDSSSLKGKWTVLFSYPLAHTFVCTTETIAFNEKLSEFRQLGAEVVAFSVDSPFTTLAWQKTPLADGGIGAIGYPIVSDLQHSIARSFGVLIEDGPDAGVTLRAVFIIDPQNVVRHMSVNDLPVGRNVDEVLRLVKAFQTADKTQKVCPSKWRDVDDDLIIPDPEKKLEYFRKVNKQ